jgi:hypothetical protein
MRNNVIDDLKNNSKSSKNRRDKLDFQSELNEVELKYLLGLIANSEFKGVDLQTIYSITAKIQNKLLK